MFLIGQSKLFVRFLSRKTTWSTSSMNMKVIDADTDPGEPLTQEEVDWMFRSEEQDGGEYTSMTERGRDPNEVIKVSMLEHRRAWWRRGERRRHCAIAGVAFLILTCRCIARMPATLMRRGSRRRRRSAPCRPASRRTTSLR